MSGAEGVGGVAYLVLHVLQAGGEVDGEDDENDVALGIAERPQPVVLLLAGCVPERELDELAVELHVCYVVLEDGGDVCLRALSAGRFGRVYTVPWLRTSGKRFSA